MKRTIAAAGLAGAAYAGRKYLVRLLTRLTGTWIGTPTDRLGG